MLCFFRGQYRVLCYNNGVSKMNWKRKKILTFILMFSALFIIALDADIYTRSVFDVSVFGFNSLNYETIWLGFSVSWIVFILMILYFIRAKKRLKVFTIMDILLDILLFAQVCYAQQLGKFMVVSDLFLAGEGLQYIKSIFLNLNFGMILTIILNIILVLLIWALNKKREDEENLKNKKAAFVIFMAIIISSRLISYNMLGHDVDSNNWQENYNAKNIYNNFTNPNSTMFVSGFYEYHVRAIYKYFSNLITLDKETLRVNVDNYNKIYGSTKTSNDYTGLFKGKSVIVVMMESIDSWIIDNQTMPTLKYLMDTGLNFENRYSPFFNGGQTINSEFALNTGLYAISDKTTIYDLDDVEYPYSLAATLKENGYRVNSFHANTGKFYNRSEFHKRLGYDNHYSALDLQKEGILKKENNYFSDSTFISDDTLYDYFVSDDLFLSFITTYSAHLEYTDDNKVYKSIPHYLDKKDMSEEEYIYRTLASDTDRFLRILLKRLESSGKLDDVVIVLATDHYVYGYSDPAYVAEKKGVMNDRKELQKTPLVIWSNDVKHEDISEILDTADVLPTLLNLLGIEYNPNNYMGDDVFSSNHDKFVWFADGTYIASSSCDLAHEAILTKVNYNISKNKAILLTNYYGKESR